MTSFYVLINDLAKRGSKLLHTSYTHAHAHVHTEFSNSKNIVEKVVNKNMNNWPK